MGLRRKLTRTTTRHLSSAYTLLRSHPATNLPSLVYAPHQSLQLARPSHTTPPPVVCTTTLIIIPCPPTYPPIHPFDCLSVIRMTWTLLSSLVCVLPLHIRNTLHNPASFFVNLFVSTLVTVFCCCFHPMTLCPLPACVLFYVVARL